MDDLDLVVDAAREAGQIGLKYFKKDPETWTKGKDSPVTEADVAIDDYLKNTLIGARPAYGWLSEESVDSKERLMARKTFIVDPIDGTRGFIEGTENWMVSIAVVEMGCPTIGVLYGPAMEKLYIGIDGEGATCNGKRINVKHAESLSEGEFVIPARMADSIQSSLATQMKRAPYIHSLAYRVALVADGTFSGAVARPGARDWDVAAADLILTEAGGIFTNIKGDRPVYNRAETRHEWLLSSGRLVQKSLMNAAIAAIESNDS